MLHVHLNVKSGLGQNRIHSRNVYIEFIICQNDAGPFVVNVYYKNQCAEENNLGTLLENKG